MELIEKLKQQNLPPEEFPLEKVVIKESEKDNQFNLKVRWLRNQVVRKEKVMLKNKVNLKEISMNQQNKSASNTLTIADNTKFVFDTKG